MRLLAAIALLAHASGAPAQDRVARHYGYAYHLDTGRYAFTEVLEQRFAGGEWVGGSAAYFLPDGKQFGRKTLDFSRDPFVPAYRLELKDSHVEAITDNGNPVTMRREHGGKVETATAAKTGLTTADAGLPRLLRAHFDALLRGETLHFRVIAPTRLATFKFRAARAEDVAFEGKPAVRIEVKLDSMLKLFAGPLSFLFDPESKRLLEFRGTTNVIDPATGEPFNVRISYFSAPPRDAPLLRQLGSGT